ncbi:MAG TPA: phosphoribosylglycinamide formyltransferase [Spongiibacteraceae bacterium]|nr:phosphoribosylglycinamide formyltransferase [Spongiibacteraceae bacterium]HCS26640.1 phosphoribosylglycinamide formyltransferase [Spongiibacteraceae bacterium]|tara:strand:- start:4191 stop:4862 length:672 start_codon:yes stop_codon:yes gene_type:complete
MPCRTVILISGSGSNLQAFIDACNNRTLDADLCAVISNRPDAAGLQRASEAGIAARALDHRSFASREAFDQALKALIDEFSPELVILAGFMRILGADFVRHFRGRLLNIHPSLLPKYPGLHTHRRAIEAGDREAGATVHFVTEELDGGPPILQAKVPVMADDSPELLASRVLEQEHRIYPVAAQWFAENRLTLQGNRAELDGIQLPETGFAFQELQTSAGHLA